MAMEDTVPASCSATCRSALRSSSRKVLGAVEDAPDA
ncbi:hypothetical protein GZL_07998 [Streptomyces sp. 769]|nr:hypothetical protein GZL_07998 [Streptomyces sp. 769]